MMVKSSGTSDICRRIRSSSEMPWEWENVRMGEWEIGGMGEGSAGISVIMSGCIRVFACLCVRASSCILLSFIIPFDVITDN